MLAHQDGEERTGPLSCRTGPKASGRVIACRSPTSSFTHCLPASLSIYTLIKSSMWMSHDLPPTPGPPVPLREATPDGQSSNYLMRDRDNTLGSCFARVAATSGSKMLTTPSHANAPMRSVNSFWAACVESVSITFSSSRRSSCIVSCMPRSGTSIQPDRIKASNNRFQNGMVSLFLQITLEARSSPSHSCVDDTMMTAEALDL
jgi:hypothetical protein